MHLLLIITLILSGVTLMAAEQQNEAVDEIVYRVGVLAIRGFPAAYAEFNSTFSDYLTASAGAALSSSQPGGRRIRFELKPLNFGLLFTDVADRLVDFIYVNPSAYSCIESEYGANSLASQISLRKVSGNEYRLTQFGGVIFSKADRNDIQSVNDLVNKTVAAANIAGLGSGQMQFRLLQQKGMSYINDPVRLVFTSNQGKVVAGVLSGEFDVGFVRTDQLERSKNKDGDPIDLDSVKIIEPIDKLRGDDGELFPFDSSTSLYPEWNIASLTFVPEDVGRRVQRAMLDLSRHADIGKELEQCHQSCEPEAVEEEAVEGDGKAEGMSDETTNTNGETIILIEACRNVCSTQIIPEATCQATNQNNPGNIFATPYADNISDAAVTTVESTATFGLPFQTSPELALLAHKARQRGKYAGWRSTLSYMELRNMQEETGFIQRQVALPANGTAGAGGMACVRASKIYDAVVCPPGHFRKSLKEVEKGCFSKEVGSIGCPEGMQCLCRPCKKAYDVDVFPIITDSSAPAVGGAGDGATLFTDARLAGSGGCAKMSICGTQQQRQALTFLVVDNRKRDNLEVGVVISQGDETRNIVAMPLRANSGGNSTTDLGDAADVYEDPNRYAYQFTVSSSNVGVVILEIFASNVQIGESPLRVEYTPRDCSGEFDDALLSADPEGNCICMDNSVEIGGRCVAMSTLLPAILVPLALIALISIRFYVERKRKQADSVWNVTSEELKFDNPPEIVGRGTFGLVLAAEYRGTKVAVKRVIPPKVSDQYRRRSSNGRNVLRRQSSQGGKDLRRQSSSLAVEVDHAFLGVHDRRRYSMMSSFRSVPSSGGEDDGDLESGLRSTEGLNSGVSCSVDGLNSGNHASGMASGTIPTIETKVSTLSIVTSPFHKDQYTKLKADFITEMRHLSKLRHPCVTTVMGALISKKEEPMLVMEFMDHGSLYDLLHNTTMVIEGELLLPILQDIAKGVRFLHAADPLVIHGDLKAANVLVDSKFRAKVADFGLSQKKRVGATGTPFWMAPELLRRETENTTASDVYSFGIILYEVYSRKDPYENEDYKAVMQLVADPKVNKRPPVPPSCPPQVEILMSDCLVSAPHNRPSFEELDQRLRRLEVGNIEPSGQQTFSLQSRKSSKMQRTDDLLFEVFPQHVAEALRDGRKVEPEHRDMVTIFFSDIVSFTDISGQLSPLKVSDMLDRLYSRFDDISREHDVFKVETIGDAYMAVTNLVKDQPDHARRIAAFSVDVIEAANETLIDLDDELLGHVNIRVGFHSGPVVANVVGSRNPRYCLFGDTVNTASRMESNSEENRIHCSERAAKLVEEQYPEISIKERGKIQIKGKGKMKTYWINEKGRRRGDIEQSVESNRSYSAQHLVSSASGTGFHASCMSDPGAIDRRPTPDDPRSEGTSFLYRVNRNTRPAAGESPPSASDDENDDPPMPATRPCAPSSRRKNSGALGRGFDASDDDDLPMPATRPSEPSRLRRSSNSRVGFDVVRARASLLGRLREADVNGNSTGEGRRTTATARRPFVREKCQSSLRSCLEDMGFDAADVERAIESTNASSSGDATRVVEWLGGQCGSDGNDSRDKHGDNHEKGHGVIDKSGTEDSDERVEDLKQSMQGMGFSSEDIQRSKEIYRRHSDQLDAQEFISAMLEVDGDDEDDGISVMSRPTVPGRTAGDDGNERSASGRARSKSKSSPDHKESIVRSISEMGFGMAQIEDAIDDMRRSGTDRIDMDNVLGVLLSDADNGNPPPLNRRSSLANVDNQPSMKRSYRERSSRSSVSVTNPTSSQGASAHGREENDDDGSTLGSIEISPGQYAKLLKGRRTWNAMHDGTAVSAACIVCAAALKCCPEADYVLCPDCNVVSPLPKHDRGGTGGIVGAVGLGYKKE